MALKGTGETNMAAVKEKEYTTEDLYTNPDLLSAFSDYSKEKHSVEISKFITAFIELQRLFELKKGNSIDPEVKAQVEYICNEFIVIDSKNQLNISDITLKKLAKDLEENDFDPELLIKFNKQNQELKDFIRISALPNFKKSKQYADFLVTQKLKELRDLIDDNQNTLFLIEKYLLISEKQQAVKPLASDKENILDAKKSKASKLLGVDDSPKTKGKAFTSLFTSSKKGEKLPLGEQRQFGSALMQENAQLAATVKAVLEITDQKMNKLDLQGIEDNLKKLKGNLEKLHAGLLEEAKPGILKESDVERKKLVERLVVMVEDTLGISKPQEKKPGRRI